MKRSQKRVVLYFIDLFMIYIDNLLEFVRKAIDTNLSGLHFPQNKEYVTTSQLVKTIRDVNGKNTLLTAIFNPIIKPLSNVSQFNKLFGNLVYAKELSTEVFDYQVADFHESVRKSEEK